MNDKGKDANSDWLADQWDERSVLGHARVNFDWRLALQRKIQKTFADSTPNNFAERDNNRLLGAEFLTHPSRNGANPREYSLTFIMGDGPCLNFLVGPQALSLVICGPQVLSFILRAPLQKFIC